MHTKILHHLFRIVSEDAIRAPLWDVEALGPAAFPNNAAYVHQQVSQLLTTSFSNLRPQQVEVSTCPLSGNPDRMVHSLKMHSWAWLLLASLLCWQK